MLQSELTISREQDYLIILQRDKSIDSSEDRVITEHTQTSGIEEKFTHLMGRWCSVCSVDNFKGCEKEL